MSNGRLPSHDHLRDVDPFSHYSNTFQKKKLRREGGKSTVRPQLLLPLARRRGKHILTILQKGGRGVEEFFLEGGADAKRVVNFWWGRFRVFRESNYKQTARCITSYFSPVFILVFLILFFGRKISGLYLYFIIRKYKQNFSFLEAFLLI